MGLLCVLSDFSGSIQISKSRPHWGLWAKDGFDVIFLAPSTSDGSVAGLFAEEVLVSGDKLRRILVSVTVGPPNGADRWY